MGDDLIPDSIGAAVRLLRKAKGFSLDGLAVRARMSKSLLSRIESGHRRLAVDNARVLDQVLGTSVLCDLAKEGDDMQRRKLLALAAVTPMATTDGLQRLLEGVTSSLPTRVGLADVGAVSRACELATTVDLAHGGGAAAGLARSSLDWAVKLLGRSMADDVRGKLHTEVAALADRLGFAYWDAGNLAGSRQAYELALNAARGGDSPDMTAQVLLDLTLRANRMQQYERADGYITAALDTRAVSSLMRAYLHGIKARTMAYLGDAQGSRRHVMLSQEMQADADPAETLSHVRSWPATPGALEDTRARCHLGAGRHEQAIEGFTSTVTRLGDTRARAVTMSYANLATAYLRAGYPDMAGHAAQQAIDRLPAVRSTRVVEALTEVSVVAGRAGQRGLARTVVEAVGV